MLDTLEPFNGRETAVAVWSIAFVALVCWKRDIRNAFLNVAVCALRWKIVLIFCVAVGWTALGVLGLYVIGFWNSSLLKDSVIFACFSSLDLAWRAVKAEDSRELLISATKDLLSLTILFEFVSNAYPFSFWIELVVIVPMSLLVVLLNTPSRSDSTAAKTDKSTSCITSIMTLSFLFCIGWALVHDIGKVTSIEAVRQFSLPILLAVIELPVLYMISLSCAYENLCIRFRIGTVRPFYIRFYGALKLMDYFGLSLTRARLALRRLSLKLIEARTHDEIDALIVNDRAELERKASVLAWRICECARARASGADVIPELKPLLDDPWRATEFVLELGLLDTLPGDPAWRFAEPDWYGLAKMEVPSEPAKDRWELRNDITCLHSSKREDRVEFVRWTVNVFDENRTESAWSSFRALCYQYLGALGWPFPQDLFANMDVRADRSIENRFATFDLKHFEYRLGHGWQLTVSPNRACLK